MARPTYEQDKDVSAQAFVASELEYAWGAELYPTPQFSCIDFFARWPDKRLGIIEIKRRMNLIGKYPTLLISKRKIDGAAGIADFLGIAFHLCVHWDDGIFSRQIKLSDLPTLRVDRGGRWDRNDAGDIEDCYHLPTGTFERITALVS